MTILDPQQQLLAVAEGLGIPNPTSWLWLQPGQLKLIAEAIAKQARLAVPQEPKAIFTMFPGREWHCKTVHCGVLNPYEVQHCLNCGAPEPQGDGK